jgi:hypothetical protein
LHALRPAHLCGCGRDQPHLSRLLLRVLGRAGAPPGANTAARLVRVVQRLLLAVKLRASLPHDFPLEVASPPISPPVLRSLRGTARTLCTPRCAAQLLACHASPPASAVHLAPAEQAAPGSRGLMFGWGGHRPGQDGSHRRQASLDVAMRKLRLSDDSSYHSPGASSDAEASGPASQLLPSAERAPLGASRFATLKAQAGLGGASSAELGALEEEEEESEQAHGPAAAANGTAHLAEEDSTPASQGAASRGAEGNGTAVSGPVAAAENLPQAEQPSPWHGKDVLGISLATLELLADWLVHAPAPSR